MMEFTDFQRACRTLLPEISLLFNEPMSKHTSFRIGGPAEVMAFPKSPEELRKLLNASKEMDCNFAILGAGTNVLAPDCGIAGLVICLKDCLDGMQIIDNSCIRVAAGVTMTRSAVFAASNGLSGLEFAHGIPGTVGGGVFMNAGAYGGQLSDICKSVDVMHSDGEIVTLTAEQMEFSYRHSRLEETTDIVLSAVFQLAERPEVEIRAYMQELMAKRKASQPLEYPSAGSAFKRPVGGYAAALIDQTGLKGMSVGKAAVSQKHAGFVINLGGATSADVKTLLQKVAEAVKSNTGIALEPEIRIW